MLRHIVPPTGAKGLNTGGVGYPLPLQWVAPNSTKMGSPEGLDTYSEKALARVWKTRTVQAGGSRLSCTASPDQTEFDVKMQIAEIEFLRTNEAAQKAMAENYVGPSLLRVQINKLSVTYNFAKLGNELPLSTRY